MNGRIGQQFGSYRLLRLIGSGGFAEVYLGEHIHLQTQAAIKVISTPLLQVDQQNYLREARVQVGLKHPHILHLLDCGIEQGLPFLVMDYAPHGTLRQRHARGVRVPTQQIISYLSAIAPALQYAHDQNLIHRDLKPENMLIGQNGEVLLSDFGIAIIPSTSKPSVTYDAVGTAVYMAPEQIMGHPVYASDQYALGIVVYEWLVGTPPFQGLLQEITTQHLHALPPPFHQKGVYLQPTVEAIVMKALDKDPMKRFASVQDFALALTSHGQSMSPPTTHSSPSNKGMPSQSILISPPSSSAQITNYPNMTNSPAPPPPPHLAPTYYSQIPSNPPPLAPTPYPPSNPTLLAPTLYPNAPAKTSIRRRSLLAIGCFGTAVLGCGALGYGTLSLILRGAATIPPLLTNTSPLLTNTSPLLHSTRYTSGSTSSVSSVEWSPDGKMLASGDVAGRINIWSVKPSSNTPITSYLYLPSSSVNSITWSPDGQSIAAGYNDFTIHIWRGTSRKPLLSYSDHKDPIYNLAWSSQQNLIASVSSGSFAYDVHIWDATTGERVINKFPLTPERKVSSLVWSHKSSPLSLAISVQYPTGSVYIWKQNENPPFGEPFQLNPPITAVAWKEDDTQLLIATDPSMFQDYENSVFTLSPGATSTGDVPFHEKYPDSNGVKAICWNAGLIYAACSNGTLHIEDGNPGHAIQYQTSTDGVTQNQSAWAWSPNGKYFAHGMIDGSVVVWQVP